MILHIFIKSTETFQNILGSQNESAKKFGLGFKDPSKIIESFVPKKAVIIKTECCNKEKSLRRTNPQGPNITWVPKVFILSNVGLASGCKNRTMVPG